MAAQTYHFGTLVDDAGLELAGATVTIASVTDPAGVAVSAHGATVMGVDGANVLVGSDLFVSYDPTAKADAVVKLTVAKAARTITGFNAAPRAFLTRDSQAFATLLTRLPQAILFVPTTGEAKADFFRAGVAVLASSPTAEAVAVVAEMDANSTQLAAIKAKTNLLPASPAAVGSVMVLDLTQTVGVGGAVGTLGHALNAARVQAFGNWVIDAVAQTLTLKNHDGTTFLVFSVPGLPNPLGRTRV